MRAWFSIVFLGCACGTAKPPKPLYPDPGRPLSAGEVATLHGDVRKVDGNVVSENGGAFALLPGCHLVGVVENWGRLDMNGGGVVVKVPPIVYAMPMRGGYRYIVRIEADHGMAGGGATIKATEEDAQGNVTGQFAPANAQAVADCQSGG
jgi:hypothetical protein